LIEALDRGATASGDVRVSTMVPVDAPADIISGVPPPEELIG
jgi:hypothetical protein